MQSAQRSKPAAEKKPSKQKAMKDDIQVMRLDQAVEIIKQGYGYTADDKAQEMQTLQRAFRQATTTDRVGRDDKFKQFVYSNIGGIIASCLKCTTSTKNPVSLSSFIPLLQIKAYPLI